MTDDRRAQLVEKIRRMMALAENPGATEEERDQAARTATKWIAKHQIEAAELRDAKDANAKAEIVIFRMQISNKLGLGARRADALANAVINPMGGKCLRTNPTSTAQNSVMTVFISEDIKDAVEVLLTSLLLQMESSLALAAKKRRRFLNEETWSSAQEINNDIRAFRISYLMTYGSTVGQRIKEGRKEALAEARFEAQAEAYANGVEGKELANVGSALVLVDESARTASFMDDWYQKQYGHKPRKGPRLRTFSASGSRAGHHDGQRADIGQTRITA